jgi:hypothetical protein
MRQGAQWLRESKPTVVAELFLCTLDLNLIREKRARYGGREISHRIAAAFHSQLAALSRHQDHWQPKATSNLVGMGTRAPGEPSLVLVNFGVGID